MYNQFMCHADFAKSKPEWNLEPSKVDKGYWDLQTLGTNVINFGMNLIVNLFNCSYFFNKFIC